jgi:outer membrane protein OmpA-like peptidoglycan-associated protein
MGNAKEYLANEVAFNTYNINRDTDLEYDIDVLLERIELDKPIVLQNIYYDFDKADLRPESVAELDRLVKIMRDNPQITIEIGSHTDSNGTEPYNIELSQRRAKSVVDYLLAKTVAKDRLSYFGFGESRLLIYPEMSDMDEQINRRTEFRIKSFDYAPPVNMQ